MSKFLNKSVNWGGVDGSWVVLSLLGFMGGAVVS